MARKGWVGAGPLEDATPPTCPWCGHEDNCQAGIPGESPHHFLCCLDRHSPACIRTERTALNRIMREDIEREVS